MVSICIRVCINRVSLSILLVISSIGIFFSIPAHAVLSRVSSFLHTQAESGGKQRK